MSETENTGPWMQYASEEHVPLLLLLQEAFHNYTPDEKKEGGATFLFEATNDPFSEDDFRNIVSKKECVLLMYEENPLGYMLIDTCSLTQGLKDHEKNITTLKEQGYLDEQSKLIPRYAELLNPGLYNEEYNEIRWKLLMYLIYYNKEKYDCMLYAFFTNAKELMEKLDMRWKIAFDNGMYFFMIWEFNQVSWTQTEDKEG